MMLADLAGESGQAVSLDAMLGFQTLGEDDRKINTNRQSELESERRKRYEETPGFKRGTPPGTMEDSTCRESMQSSTLQQSPTNGMQSSTLRKSDQYKRKSGQKPAAGSQQQQMSNSFKRNSAT